MADANDEIRIGLALGALFMMRRFALAACFAFDARASVKIATSSRA
jgi:hypothetical protein